VENIIIYVNGIKISTNKNKTIYDIVKESSILPDNVLFIIKNGEYCSYNEYPENGDVIQTVEEYNSTAKRIYENTCATLLYHVASKILPDKKLVIAHSMSNGLYCKINSETTNIEKYIEALYRELTETIAKNIKINPIKVSKRDALKYFTKIGRKDTAELLKYYPENEIKLYEIEFVLYWAPTPLLSSTSCIRKVDLKSYKRGFIIRYPIEGDINIIPEFTPQEKLFEIFNEHEQWGEILNLSDVSHINRAIKNGTIDEIIKISEALHERKIVFIAEEINRINEEKRVVFISGPSSSGKTTFMKRLYIQLRVLGHNIITISLDNYYKDRKQLIKEQGKNLNFEIPEALDLDLLKKHIKALITGEKVKLPKFNFKLGIKEYTNEVKASNNCVILIEGIHGLNPKITSVVNNKNVYKIYISALTHLNFDNANRIPTHELRLIRRIVRDSKFRNHDAEETIHTWAKVIEGEKNFIFPFQEEADVMFNSSLVYELAALKRYAVNYLKKIPKTSSVYPEATRLMDILKCFLTINEKPVPSNSILREFIGGSSFKY